MNEVVYMLQHEGRLLFWCGAFETLHSAQAASEDAGVISGCQPSSVVKYFGKPGEYEQMLAEFQPPTVVSFIRYEA